jgi:two-component system, OmpR family, response regulator RegX3
MTRILMIEDEESLGEALEYQLVREGFDVARERNGATGLQHFRTSGADLVLLDLMLPGLSGEEVCKEIRTESRVPIIMLTAKDEEIDTVLGLELGADDYVTKPSSWLVSRRCYGEQRRRPPGRRTCSRGAVSGWTGTGSRSSLVAKKYG